MQHIDQQCVYCFKPLISNEVIKSLHGSTGCFLFSE
jgi:hypothetical protein